MESQIARTRSVRLGRHRAHRASSAFWALAVYLAISLSLSTNAAAFALRIGNGGPLGASFATDVANVLYAGDVQGHLTRIVGIGDSVDGGRVVDLGVPATMPDGSVVFSVEILGPGSRQLWEIFVADLSKPPKQRLSRPLEGASRGPTCSPSLKGDPYPVSDDQGAIIFAARQSLGGDALYALRGGEIACLAHVDDLTNKGHRLKLLAFGSVQATGDRQITLQGTLDDGRRVLLLASPNSALTEIAAEGESAPSGGKFGHNFGLPAIVETDGKATITFTNYAERDGALFVYHSGGTTKILSFRDETPLGPVKFLSPGRPALSLDGSVAVLAGFRGFSAVIAVNGTTHQRSIVGSGLTDGLNEVGSFSDPSLTSSGAMVLGAVDQDGHESVYTVPSEGVSRSAPPVPRLISFRTTSRHPQMMTGSLSVNAKGQFSCLGGTSR